MSHADLLHLARLARLHLTDRELAAYGGQLDTVLEHFRTLQEVELEGGSSAGTAPELENVFRDDELRPSMPRSQALQNVDGDLEDNCPRIPRVV